MKFIPDDSIRKKEINEQGTKINFLDEKVVVSFKIDKTAVKYLPEVTDSDLETKREKYRVLLGKIIQYRPKAVKIVINGILELKKNEPQYYTEGTNEIHSIDIPALQKLVTKIQGENPEFKQYDLIGEIHTHPIIPNKLSQNQHPCDPSDGDVGSISDHYERNVLKPDEPFIFGIAGRGENGQTEYAFYRLIKKDGRYEVRSLN